MIIRLKKNTNSEQLNSIQNKIKSLGCDFFYREKHNEIIVSKLNNEKPFEIFDFVDEVLLIETRHQLSNTIYKNKTRFSVKDIEINSGVATIIAGPCSIENEEQIFKTAEFISKLGVKFIRGGAFKPRTSPYNFRGLGIDGLKFISAAAKKFDLRVVTELMDLSLLDDVYNYADVLQIGSRNMSNFYMLNELGKINKPVMLKRGSNSKTFEWLLAADYIMCGGNEQIILCERGIRSFDPEMRNVFDLNVIPLVKSMSHLPIFADPSHGCGNATFVPQMSLAALAAGADGLMIEIHPEPAKALSDSQQALSFFEFEILLNKINKMTSAISNQTQNITEQNQILTSPK